MKVLSIEQGFGLENLRISERPEPGPPGIGEVLVEVKAVSLNYRDLMVISGHYNPKQKLPLIPCSDASAVVQEVGEDVTRFKTGDRVAPAFCQKWESGPPTLEKLRSTLGSPVDGTLRKQLTLRETGLVKIPDYLNDDEASTLPCAAVTAWNALVTRGSLSPGQKVLVQGSGGVATFAIQIAKAVGATVIVTSQSERKRSRLKMLGADIVLARGENWAREVTAQVGEEGIDHVVELGGSNSLPSSLEIVRPGGMISLIGVLSGTVSELNIVPLLMKRIQINGILVGSRSDFEDMNRFLEAHNIHPIIDSVFCFTDAGKAFQRMAEQAHFGKIVVRVN